jgi:hypothetical protein
MEQRKDLAVIKTDISIYKAASKDYGATRLDEFQTRLMLIGISCAGSTFQQDVRCMLIRKNSLAPITGHKEPLFSIFSLPT